MKELDEFGDSDSDDDDYDDDDDDDLFLEKDQHRRDLIKAQKRVKRVQDRKYRQTMPAFGNEPVIATSGAVSSSSSHPLLPTTVTAPTATPATAVVVVSTSTDTKKTSSKPSQKPSGVQQQQQQQQQQQPPSDPKRALIVRELITTERTYLEVLMQIVTQFVVPCREEGVLTAEDGQALFSNTESLYQLHSEFLAYLEEAYAEHKSIGHLFVQFGPLLRLYKQYAAEHDKALTTLARLSRTSSFVEFCKGPIGSGTVSPENIYLFVTSLIITPIQRIPRYLLLLKDLTAHTDPATEEYDNLEKASTLLNEIATEVNQCKKKKKEGANTLIGFTFYSRL